MYLMGLNPILGYYALPASPGVGWVSANARTADRCCKKPF